MIKKNPFAQISWKERLIIWYSKGYLSIFLLLSMLLTVILISVNRLRHLKLFKELALVPFTQAPDLTKSYQTLSNAFSMELVLILITWVLMATYFMAWLFKHKKIRMDSITVYLLFGFFFFSVLYLFFYHPITLKVYAHERCLVEEGCKLFEPLSDLGHAMNYKGLYIQASFIVMLVTALLSILALLADRVSNLIVFVKNKPVEVKVI